MAGFLAYLKGCLAGFVASSRAGLGLLMWVVFVGIIFSIIGLKGEECYYLIGNNMLDNCCLMNVDIYIYAYILTLK